MNHYERQFCVLADSDKPPIGSQHGTQTRIAKQYEGKRGIGGALVTVDGQNLNPRFDLRCHSPSGFEWGYPGSGPAQLALALLADHLGDGKQALEKYQAFKFAVVAGLPREGWTLNSTDIETALAEWQRKETT